MQAPGIVIHSETIDLAHHLTPFDCYVRNSNQPLRQFHGPPSDDLNLSA